VLAFIAGLIIAGGIHAAKTIARPMVTAVNGGMGDWMVSILEDMMSLIIVILALLVPLLVLFLIVTVIFFFVGCWSTRSTTT